MIMNWLVANGLYRDLLSAAILVPIMHLMAVKPLKKLIGLIQNAEAAISEHHTLEKVIDEVKKN